MFSELFGADEDGEGEAEGWHLGLFNDESGGGELVDVYRDEDDDDEHIGERERRRRKVKYSSRKLAAGLA